MNIDPKISETNQSDVTCTSCGAHLKFAPGTKSLKCEHCGSEVEIEACEQVIQEIDFDKFLADHSSEIVEQEIITIQCEGCGAHVTFDPNIVSDLCPFCGSVVIAKYCEKESQIRPGSILPFAIDSRHAFEEFRKWIKKLWFAPGDLKKFAVNHEMLKGVYVPYWTYDSKTFTKYTGQRGDNYTTTQTYTTVENGKTVTRTRTVTKIRWTSVSGSFDRFFDDVLVLASKSLPKKHADKLTPWGLDKLVPFNPKYLSGYQTETYQVGLREGFDIAQKVMDESIRYETQSRIGGDHQRIFTIHSNYNDVTFKHTLLPVWISAFRYNKKVYRFLVNGCTGEVQGERPYSAWKIVLAILGGIFILGILLLVFGTMVE
jgi:LSD1 subclass zinc finger protein